MLLVSFSSQGNVNPLLRLGNLLASKGLLVTFSTTHQVGNMLKRSNERIDEPTPVGQGMIRFEFFHDGVDQDDPRSNDFKFVNAQLELNGPIGVANIVKKHENEGRPISFIINNPFVSWVSEVAESLNIPSAVLWVQSCACFSAYYHYHHKLIPFPTDSDPKLDVTLPHMPLLKYDEFPSFLHPSDPFKIFGELLLGQFALCGFVFVGLRVWFVCV